MSLWLTGLLGSIMLIITCGGNGVTEVNGAVGVNWVTIIWGVMGATGIGGVMGLNVVNDNSQTCGFLALGSLICALRLGLFALCS